MDLPQAFARFQPITLAEMDGVKLQDRVDTKYVFAETELPGLLSAMAADYRLLEVDGKRGTEYRSLYFDTPDLRHYRDHHNKRTFRSKVRFREYIGSGLIYLEVKRKTGRGRTDKRRLRVEAIPDELHGELLRFVQEAEGSRDEFRPVLWNHFTRYTFVAKDRPERLTMDIGLRFSDPQASGELGGIVVAELKQERADRSSAFVRLMRAMGERPSGMSKYCIGMLTLQRPVKHNAFKPVLLKLRRLRKAAKHQPNDA
ncbi:MAG: polyphosphate polymerase domain-containing protein [Flavobacteriales bacterium]|nr:polyphosphate polymerase domain-containing protein [Flavobacteriales bacterium]